MMAPLARNQIWGFQLSKSRLPVRLTDKRSQTDLEVDAWYKVETLLLTGDHA